jgi:three-Cys-motif partner protein
MSNRLPAVWDADPHTIAKIAILKGYLNAWFRILGKTRKGQTILYVDGFAGPGYYRNHDEGSPLAAIRAAESALQSLDSDFIADKLHCAFIESRADRFRVLNDTVSPFVGKAKLGITRAHCEFVDGIELVRKEVPGPFRGEGPLFVFADPFGGTGIPFKTFQDCMKSEAAELLINLDADGIGRMFAAENNNRDAQLTELFGCDKWRDALTARNDFGKLSVQILDLYKKRLRTLPNVKYIWSFAMRGKADLISYHLVFASKHPLGLKKMKEAMQVIDKTGCYSFSDAHVDQQVLFREDNEEVYAEVMFKSFNGKTLSMAEANDFALTETPFLNAKPLLGVLEKKYRIKVDPLPGMSVRAGTFPEEKVARIQFGQFSLVPAQPELF